MQVDIKIGEKTYVYLRYNYSNKNMKRGVTKIKKHIFASHKNFTPCAKALKEVKEEIHAYIKEIDGPPDTDNMMIGRMYA